MMGTAAERNPPDRRRGQLTAHLFDPLVGERRGLGQTWLHEPRPLVGTLPIRGILGFTWWSLLTALCLVLATRALGITYDDQNYLHAFSRTGGEAYRSWWHYLIEEPGWRVLTEILSPLGPELAYRIVLFTAPAAFILSCNRIAGGRWLAVGWWSWIILAVMLIERGLVTSMYVTTIRQGLATSLFLVLVASRTPPFAATLLAGTVHSAFLAIAPAVLMAETFGRDRNLTVLAALGVVLYAVLLAYGLAPSPFSDLDLGRRSLTYDDAAGLNLLGHAISAALYGGTLYFVRATSSPWLSASLILLAATAAMSIANPGFIRLYLSLNAFVLMAVMGARPRPRTLAIGFWFALTMAITLWEGRSAVLPQDSWLGLWSLILSR